MFNCLFVFTFRFFFRLIFRKHIGNVLFKTESLDSLLDSSLPVMLLSNHVSWWDGFFLQFLAEKIMPGRNLLVVMLNTEWKKRRWLSHLGAIPIDPKSPSQLLGFFRRLKQERARSSNFCLVYFFEGKIAEPGQNQSRPRRGTDLVINAIGPAMVLPISLVVDVRYRSKPTAYVNAAAPVLVADTKDLEAIYLTIDSLTRATLHDTTEAQEFHQALIAKGWKHLW